MKTIKHIDIKVTYSVGLSDVEVSDDVYEDLMNCEGMGLSDDNLRMTPNDLNAMEWLRDNIKETDAYEAEFEIQEIL